MKFIRKSALVGAVVSLTLLASACNDDSDAESSVDSVTEVTETGDPVAAAQARVEAAEAGVADAQTALTAAGEEFCVNTGGYVESLDRYSKLFTDDTATVGDVTTLGADLVEPRETVSSAADAYFAARDALAAAEQELVDAQAALAEAIAIASSVPTSSTTPGTTTTTTIVPAATVERVQQAEEDLAEIGSGVDENTPLAQATAEYNSAAFALQISWMRLLVDAGCLDDEQMAQAVEWVTAYTATLQTQLQLAGYYDGAIDGIYGPETVDAVKRLQADSGLRETGFVDMATSAALGEILAAQTMTQTASVQTVLTLTGFWTGPIDGVWTDELTVALQAFQTALGVEPTGVVDAATLAAFQQALAALQGGPAPTVPPASTTPPAASTAPPAAPEATVVVSENVLGQILTDATGITVYLFTPDAQGAPTCIDACVGAWPPLLVADAAQVVAGDGVDAALLATVDHPEGIQVTYNSWPLYYFSGDVAAGDTNGQGQQGGLWFVVDPAGNQIPPV